MNPDTHAVVRIRLCGPDERAREGRDCGIIALAQDVLDVVLNAAARGEGLGRRRTFNPARGKGSERAGLFTL